jgi:hypothetical protein
VNELFTPRVEWLPLFVKIVESGDYLLKFAKIKNVGGLLFSVFDWVSIDIHCVHHQNLRKR